MEGEMVVIKKINLKISAITLQLGLLWCLPASLLARDITSVGGLKRSLSAVNDQWPTMSAVLVYNSVESTPADMKKFKRTFSRASRDRRYREYVDFLYLDFGAMDADEKNELQEIVAIADAPLVVLFFNNQKIDTLIGERIGRERVVADFVNNGFEGDVLKIKRSQQAKIERIIRYEDRPRVYWGASFGAPFYAHHHYGWPRYGYHYPYDHGFYFGW